MRDSSAGGSAMQGGADYQNRVAAWIATKMLSEGSAEPIGPSGKVVYLAAETEASVDDLLVGSESGGYAFIQAKRKLSLSERENSDLASTVKQAVRQLTADDVKKRPWSRSLNPGSDRILLVTSSDSGAPITVHLRSVMRRAPGLDPAQHLSDAAKTIQESRALTVMLSHLHREWQRETGRGPTEAEQRTFLTLFNIEVLDVGPGQTGEREAKTELRTVVLPPTAQENLAWNSLVIVCVRAAIERTGFSVTSLRSTLRGEGVQLQPQWGFRSDIEKLRNHTKATLGMLADLSRIRFGGADLQIDRPAIPQLLRAAEQSSCVIVGPPGAGKSGVVYEAGSRLVAAERDVLCLAIDKLELSSISQLRDELNLDHPVLDVLNQWDGDHPAILLIDALDAARGDAAAATILSFLQQLKSANNRWNIVASVRKWDLRNSPLLHDLFRATHNLALPAELTDSEFWNTNHINIDIFTLEELDRICAEAADLQKLREAADAAMVELLRVPFNLRLAANLLDGGMTPAEFSPLRDQMSLLQAYWDRRVTPKPGGDRREQVLRLTLDNMVEHRRLRAERGKAVASGGEDALEELLSSNVLTEWRPSPASAPNRHLIAFSHNVLFDFGAEQLTLPHELDDLVNLALERPELIIILRPSFHMRLQRLWMADRNAFWDLTLRLCSTASLSSLVQSCPLVVVAENARTPTDVSFLTDQLSNDPSLQRPGVGTAYRHLVGVLVSGGRENRPDLGMAAGPWISLAVAAVTPSAIAQMIDVQSWIDSAKTQWDSRTFEQDLQLGRIARRLLETAWAGDHRNSPWIVASIRNVCKTFASDPDASAALLRQALEPEHVAAHGYEELKWIAESASELAALDPSFVADLYIAAFSWRETAEDSTHVLKSRIHGFRSNKRQDYEHARWDLARRYPRLLSADPILATTAMIQIVEVYSRDEHQSSSEIEPFQLGEVATGIRTDYSSIWDSGPQSDENAGAILNSCFRYLNEQAAIETSAAVVATLIDQLIRGARAAVLWCRLLELAATHPRIAHQIREAAWSKPLLLAHDTVRPMHLFLHAIYMTLTMEERATLENALMELADERYGDFGKFRRDRYLGAISSYDVVTEQARIRLEELRAEESLEQEAPRKHMVFGGAMQVDPEHLYSLRGVDPSTPGNQEILILQQPIADFAGSFPNTVPSLDVAIKLLPDMQALWCALDSARPLPPSEDGMNTALAHLVEAVAKIALISELTAKSELGIFVTRVLATGASALWPEYSPEMDAFEGGYSTPWGRLEAAQGFMALACNRDFDLEWAYAGIEVLAKDPVPSVRFQIARSVLTLHERAPEEMWAIIEILARDRNARIRHEIVHNLDQAARAYPARALGLIIEVLERTDAADTGRNDLIAGCIASLTEHSVGRADGTAEVAIAKIVSGLPESAKLAVKILLPLRNAIAYVEAENPERARGIRERAASLFNQLVAASVPPTRAFIERRLRREDLSEQDEEQYEALLHLLTVSGSELYFGLGVFQEHTYGSTPQITSPVQAEAYRAVASSLDLIADIGEPQLAHSLMQILEMFIPVDPERTFLRMGRVVQAAKIWGYHNESVAVDVVVRAIRIYIADHRSIFQQNPECLRILREIMEVFMEAGWPSARNLSYRLDEIFRG